MVTQTRYCRMVDPSHPFVTEMFGGPRTPRAASLQHAIERLQTECRYTAWPSGHRTFDVLRDEWLQCADVPQPLNCINLSCLLSSYLRSAGFGADDVFVAIMTMTSYRSVTLKAVHAGVLLRRTAGWTWFDSADLRPQHLTDRELRARCSFVVLFNDAREYFAAADQRQLLSSSDPPGGPHIRVHGFAEPALTALRASAEFERLIVRMLQDRANADEDATEAAAQAMAAGLVVSHGARYAAGRRLALVPAPAERQVRDVVAPLLPDYVAILDASVERLRSAYAGCAAAAAFDWAAVEHTIVAGLLMDLAVGYRMSLPGSVLEHPAEGMVWAFEQVVAGNAFGVIWSGRSWRDRGLGQLWHRSLRRAPLKLAPRYLEAAETVALGGSPSPDTELYLRYVGLLTRERRQLAIPTFVGADVERLRAELDDAASQIADRVARPMFDELAGATRWATVTPAARSSVLRLLLEYATDAAIDGGVLSPFPGAPAPGAWGRWLSVAEPTAETAAMANAGSGLSLSPQ